MFTSSRAVRNTAGIYQKLALFLVRKCFEKLKIIVPVIVEDDVMIVFFKLRGKLVRISYLLAGGRGYLVVRVIFADVFFEYRRKNDDFVQTVVAHSHNFIAERVAEMLFFDKRVRECEAERNSSGIDRLCDLPDYLIIDNADGVSSAVPERWGKCAENGRYLHAVTEIFRVLLHKREQKQVKPAVIDKIGNMKIYIHLKFAP